MRESRWPLRGEQVGYAQGTPKGVLLCIAAVRLSCYHTKARQNKSEIARCRASIFMCGIGHRHDDGWLFRASDVFSFLRGTELETLLKL